MGVVGSFYFLFIGITDFCSAIMYLIPFFFIGIRDSMLSIGIMNSLLFPSKGFSLN